jgi:hypothetical protein
MFTDYLQFAHYFCHGFLSVYALYILMVLSRESGTITLSGQRLLLTKVFSAFIIIVTKATQMPLITFMLKIFACHDEEVYFDRLQTAVENAQKTINLNSD